MSILYYTIGLPASGKSIFFAQFLSDVAYYVSSDAIREEVFGDVKDQNHNGEVFNIMHKRTVQALKNGENVYYDSTGLSRKRRINFLHSINHIPNVTKIALVFAPPLEIVKNRNSKRVRVVPEYVIDRMIKGFEVPHKSEGWDFVRVHNTSAFDEDYLYNMVCTAKEMSHDNPHHTMTIGNHMFAAHNWIMSNAGREFSSKERRILTTAALFHDIGKPFCKTYKNMKGESCTEAHYYGHENVGAYFYLSESFGTHDDLLIACLINHHMDFFKGENYLKKIGNSYGKEFMRYLEFIHEADLAAH